MTASNLTWGGLAVLAIVSIAVLAFFYFNNQPDTNRLSPEQLRDRAFEKLAERVQRAIQSSKPTTVKTDVEAFVTQHQDFAPAYLLLGQVHFAIGETGHRRTKEEHYPQAMQAWEKSLELQPEQPNLLLLAGDLALKLDQPVKAWQWFHQLQQLKPTDPTGEVRQAIALIYQGKADEAEQALQAIMQKNSGLHQVHFAWGLLHASRQDYAQALERIDSALDILRHQPQLDRDTEYKYLLRRVDILQKQNRHGLVVNMFMDSIDGFSPLERERPEALAELAESVAAQGGPEAAAQLIYERRIGVPGNRDHWPLYEQAALWYLKAGNFDRVKELLMLMRNQLRMSYDGHLAMAITELAEKLQAQKPSTDDPD